MGLHLVRASSQSAYILDADQVGLDIVGDWTLEWWMRVNIAPTSTQVYVVAAKYDMTANQRSYQVSLEHNSDVDSGVLWMRAFFADTGADGVNHIWMRDWPIYNNDSPAIGRWYHFAVVVDVSEPIVTKGEMFDYGVSRGNGYGLISTAYNILSVNSGSGTFALGASNLGAPVGVGTNYANCDFRDVRLWNAKRTPAELRANFMPGALVAPYPASLVGYWPLATDLLDLSASGNDLTGQNAPTFVTGDPPLQVDLELLSPWAGPTPPTPLYVPSPVAVDARYGGIPLIGRGLR